MSWQIPAFWLLLSLLVTIVLRLNQRILQSVWQLRLRWLCWFLPPYLGLLTGGLSPRLMGLNAIDWQISLSLGLSICFGLLLVLTVVRATVVIAPPPEKEAALPPHLTDPHAIKLTARSAFANTFVQVLATGAEEWHWCFLRGAIGEMLQTGLFFVAPSTYWVVWIAGGVAALEQLIRQPNTFGNPLSRLLKFCQLLSTTVLFFYTRNFWLCWFLHAAIALLFQAFLPGRSPPRPQINSPVET